MAKKGLFKNIASFKVYQGEALDDKPHGFGKGQDNDGITCEGYFVNGEKHGL